MISELDDRRYGISEVTTLTDVPIHVLRQWERRFPQLKPKRDRANRRYYMPGDIAIVRRIKQLMWHEKMTSEGARKRLALELKGEGRPQTRQEAVDLVNKLEEDLLDMLKLLEEE
jgi:DNA-binding transcriptional MerR regulator